MAVPGNSPKKHKKKVKATDKLTSLKPFSKLSFTEEKTTTPRSITPLGAKSLVSALKGKVRDKIRLIRQLLRGEKIRSVMMQSASGLEKLKAGLLEELEILPIEELTQIKMPQEFSEEFNEIFIQAWRRKISKEFPQSLEIKNTIFSQSSFDALMEALLLNASLKAISIENCGLTEESCRQIAKVLRIHPLITSFHLDHNQIKSKGLAILAKSLKDSQLAHLSLEDNGIGPKGAKALTEQIVYAKSLHSINLKNNPLKEEGTLYLKRIKPYTACIFVLTEEESL